MADLVTLAATKRTHAEGAAAATPSAGEVAIYAKTDGLMYSKDDAGAETLMSGGGAAPALTEYEVGYAEITSDGTISSSTEATPTDLITAPAVNFDGSTVGIIEVFTPAFQHTPSSPASSGTLMIFEGSTNIGRIAQAISPDGATVQLSSRPVLARYRLTPSNASHTYKLSGYKTAAGSTTKIKAGSGGAGAFLPSYIRILKLT